MCIWVCHTFSSFLRRFGIGVFFIFFSFDLFYSFSFSLTLFHSFSLCVFFCFCFCPVSWLKWFHCCWPWLYFVWGRNVQCDNVNKTSIERSWCISKVINAEAKKKSWNSVKVSINSRVKAGKRPKINNRRKTKLATIATVVMATVLRHISQNRHPERGNKITKPLRNNNNNKLIDLNAMRPNSHTISNERCTHYSLHLFHSVDCTIKIKWETVQLNFMNVCISNLHESFPINLAVQFILNEQQNNTILRWPHFTLSFSLRLFLLRRF